MKNFFKRYLIIAFVAVIVFSFASCGGNGAGSGGGPKDNGNSNGEDNSNNNGSNGDNSVPTNLSAYVSTHLTVDYVYELSFEYTSSSARAAVPTPKEDGFYSLLVYDKNDGKVKGVSEGKIKRKNGGLTLKPNDTDDPDIDVNVSGGEMTEIKGETRKGGKHDLPGKVKPFKQTEGVSGNFGYVTNPGNTVTLTKYIGNDGNVEIPAQINGKTVIGIGVNAFHGNIYAAGLTSITIPDKVTIIGESAFFCCEKLISVIIPNSVKSIGGDAFTNCTSLSSVTIGSGISTLNDEPFIGCTSLASVTFKSAGVTFYTINNVFIDIPNTQSLHLAYHGGTPNPPPGGAGTYIRAPNTDTWSKK